MGRAFEVQMGFCTAPSTTLTAITPQDQDSLRVKSVKDRSKIWLRQAWNLNQTAGQMLIRSPRMHDVGDNITTGAPAANPVNLLNSIYFEQLYPQDLIDIRLSGSGTAGDLEFAAWLTEYEDLEGIDQSLIDIAELTRRGEHVFSIRNTIATPTSGNWATAEALNLEIGNFKANTEYAILGYQVDTNCIAVAYRGTQTGNLRYGGPGNKDKVFLTREFFADLARAYGGRCIPKFNASNVGNFTVNCAVDENGADPLITTYMVQLAA
jgi:hypothetical protein